MPYAPWRDTLETLHLYTQIVGKVRLAHTPWLNHSWHVPLYVTARGLTTSPIPHGSRTFDMEFDFIDHALVVRVDDGAMRVLRLGPRSVADFYAEVMGMIAALGLSTPIDPRPNEIADAVPFPDDRAHASYDGEAVQRFWRALALTDRVFKRFRTGFLGKSSPSHFFWGS
ncbi:MAG: DUF5996 family protein, partial [Caulobacterales bacterium]|nr:DUF5996 family protein [Caulobacterales bacterium]